jgi:hypothetical protein
VTYPVPGYPLYVDGAYYPAALWREFGGGTAVQDAGTASAVSPAGGVFGDPGSAMLVTPGTGLSVTVNAGYCSVPDTSGPGAYRFGLMQQATLGPVAAPGSGTRLDYVVAGVLDVGSGSSSCVEYLTGTTSPPAQPANSILLAEVAVPSTASSITSGMITDLRSFVAAPGCIVPVANAGVAPTGPSGQLFWDVATGQLLYSPVTDVVEELTGSGTWTCPPYVTSVSARAIGGGGGGTGIDSGASGSQTFTSPGTWTAPDGVTEVTVQQWGGGGGGGGSEHYYFGQDGPGGGGGGGGGYSQDTVAVTAGNGYQVTVGAGGPGGSGADSGTSGGASSFPGDSQTVTASGGQRGFSSSAGGSGGSGGAGDSGSGGSGGSGSGPGGAGGGGSAGDGFDGSPGGTTHSGTGAGGGYGYATGGGGGGTGATTGGSGGSPGAGGGGAGASSGSGPSNGGSGGAGLVILSWTPDSSGGGGGGGGEYAASPAMAVETGNAYPYSVGAGGGDSTSGGNTSFTAESASLLAYGGQASSGVATGGAGGTGGTGAVLYDGGTGGTGSASGEEQGYGGGGGASGSASGTGADGGGATATAAGAGGAAGPYGGAGGAGGSGNGGSGSAPGGGGGGDGDASSYSGGTGGNGSLTLSYTIAPGAIPYPLAGGQSWYAYDDSTAAVASVSVTIQADGVSDYEITCQASGTGAEAGGQIAGTLRILASGTQLDAIDALASSGTPAAHYNTGWSYITSGAQGTTLAQGTYTIEFAPSGVTMTGPASLRVAQVLA